jgi:hypothetical protein
MTKAHRVHALGKLPGVLPDLRAMPQVSGTAGGNAALGPVMRVRQVHANPTGLHGPGRGVP